MNKLLLIKNAELFQGKNYLNKKKNYFEDWYFKNTNIQKGISFIPGINIDDTEAKAFIQIITNNIFSKEDININIEEKSQKLKIYGNIRFSNNKNINTNIFIPNS